MSARLVVGVGVQKCATTSIANYLEANGVVIHPKKELEAFGTPHIEMTREQYLSKFPSIPTDGWFGEFTPNYASHAGSLLNLQRMFPEAKVIFSYRNPITRLQSAYRHAVSERNIPRGIDINSAIELSFRGHNNHWLDTFVRFGQYDVMLRMVERVFDPSSVYMIRYEDLNTDAEPAALAGLMRMLDLEFDPAITLQRLNTGYYQQWINAYHAQVAISPSNLARLQEFYAPVERFMRERGHRTEWF